MFLDVVTSWKARSDVFSYLFSTSVNKGGAQDRTKSTPHISIMSLTKCVFRKRRCVSFLSLHKQI